MLITSFVIMLGVITGTMYISGTGSHKENNSLLGEITVYTTLPTENVSYLAEAYEKNYHVKVNFMPMSEDDIVKQIQSEMPINTIVKNKINTQKKKMSGSTIALIVIIAILGFPIWFPILITAVSLIVCSCGLWIVKDEFFKQR